MQKSCNCVDRGYWKRSNEDNEIPFNNPFHVAKFLVVAFSCHLRF